MGKNRKNKKRKAAASKDDKSDWLSSLVKQASNNDDDGGAASINKAERIEKRNAKKRRRQERQNQKQQTKKQTVMVEEDSEDRRHELQQHKSRHSMERLSHQIKSCLSDYDNKNKHPNLFIKEEKRGKAMTWKHRWSDGDSVQPRARDYGGLGLARPSLFLSFEDPSYLPLLEQEFAEHVPGFFGKQRTKAMKRQLDGNMLWRRLAEKRCETKRVNGKKLSDMSPDERVEAMIQAGML